MTRERHRPGKADPLKKRSPSSRPRPLTLVDLTADPKNANRGTDRGRAALERSLREYGAGRAVLIDRQGRIIAGNKTVEQAKRLNIPLRVVRTDGQHLIAVQRDDLDLATDPRAKALALADNRELDLEWDVDMLKQLHAEAWISRHSGPTRSSRSSSPSRPAVSPTRTPSSRLALPTSCTGELFELGRHRLLCGDATSAGDVTRLLNGTTPILMPTDPPYGMSYDPAWRHRINPQQRTAVGRVANDDRADWTDVWKLFPGAIAYVWHAALKAPFVAADLEAAGFAIRSQIIWQKQHFALSRGDYHWAHEPAWYAVRGQGRWRGDRRQTTVWEAANLNPMGGSRTAENTVTGHGTQKPVRLFEIPIPNHTVVGEAVYDAFCGRWRDLCSRAPRRSFMRSIRVLLAAVMTTALACGGSSTAPSGLNNLTLNLTDSPFSDAKALLVTFSSVSVHLSGGAFAPVPFSGGGTSRTCDLKRLTGAQDVLGTGSLVAGHYTQIRLIVSSATIYFDNASTNPTPCAANIAAPAGRNAPVTIPSGQVDLNREFDVTNTATTTITLDFDGDQSVKETGNGTFMMTPVITVVSVQ